MFCRDLADQKEDFSEVSLSAKVFFFCSVYVSFQIPGPSFRIRILHTQEFPDLNAAFRQTENQLLSGQMFRRYIGHDAALRNAGAPSPIAGHTGRTGARGI